LLINITIKGTSNQKRKLAKCPVVLPNDEVSDTTVDDSSTTAGYPEKIGTGIICIFAVRFFENFATSQAIASHLVGMRKVRTAQSNAPVKSRLYVTLSLSKCDI
jgi:hypothetical protein